MEINLSPAKDSVKPLKGITRVVLVTKEREFDRMVKSVEISVQDDGKTLKVYVYEKD